MVRIVARDGLSSEDPVKQTHIGSISFGIKKYLGEVALGEKFTKWITLFEDELDDEYDGDFQEDDHELPMILVSFQISQTSDILPNVPAVSMSDHK